MSIDETLSDPVRSYGTGAFKKRRWTNKQGETRTSWSGYVYAIDKHKCYGTGPTQKAAERAAQEARSAYERKVESARNAPVVEPTKVPTFAEWSKGYNAIKAINNRLKSVQKYEELRRKVCDHVLPDKTRLGDRPLDQITLKDLESYQAAMRKKYAPNSAYMIVAYVRAVLQNAVDHEIIARNRAVALQKIKRSTKNTLTLDDAGFAQLFAHADERMRAGLVLGYMGMRAAEACGLTLDRIDGNHVLVCQQIARIDNPFPDSDQKTILAITGLKTGDVGSRKLTLTDEMMNILMASLDHARETTIYDARTKTFVTKTFVVCNRDGGPWHPHGYQRMFALLSKKAGVEAHHHDLRAMAVTDSITGSVPTKMVSAMVGHADTTVTEGYYNRIRREQLEPITLARSDRAIQVVGASTT